MFRYIGVFVSTNIFNLSPEKNKVLLSLEKKSKLGSLLPFAMESIAVAEIFAFFFFTFFSFEF